MSVEQLKFALEELKKKFREETKRLRQTIEEMRISHKENIESIRQEHEKDRERIKNQDLKIDELEFVIRKLKDEEVIEDLDEEEEEGEEAKQVTSTKKVVEVDEDERSDLLSRIRVEKQIMKDEQKLKKFSRILTMDHLEEMEKTIGFNRTNWKLMFRASDNGFLAKHFHKRCDGRQGTLIVIRTSKKKRVFGGYNPMKWNEEGSASQWYDSKGSFVFGFEKEDEEKSLKTLVKFEYDENGYGIRCNPHMGPCFGGPSAYALRISNDCQSSSSSFTKLDKSGYPNLGKGAYFLNGGKRGNFKVSDYEVFVRN